MSIKAAEFDKYTAEVVGRLRGNGLQPQLQQCRDIIVQSVKDAFSSSMSPEGASWPPRRDAGDGHPLLIDTSALFQAATGGAGHVSRIDPRSVTVGVQSAIVPYAAAHQSGDPSRNLPDRPYLGASRKALDECEQVVGAAVFEWF